MLSASSSLNTPRILFAFARERSLRPLASRSLQSNLHQKQFSGVKRSINRLTTTTIIGSFSSRFSTSTITTTMASSSSSTSYGTLFLGGGNAAGYFASEFDKIVTEDPALKDSAFGGSLAIVTEEDVVSYERPALSKAYLSPNDPPRLPGFHSCVGGGGGRQEPSWYESRGISYLTGTKVENVDVASKSVKLEDGREISYQKLVLGTGARPVDLSKDLKMPGALSSEEEREASSNVFYLRNRRDADALYSALGEERAKETKQDVTPPRPLVIGGGYIGLELAAALVGWGLEKPLVVFPEDRILARVMTKPASEFYSKFYESKGGVEFRSGVSVASLERGDDGRVKSAKLSDGTSVPVSLVVVGVGARPETSIFEGGSIELVRGPPGGIKVDRSLRLVSAPDSWAVGDVAAFPSSCLFGDVDGQDRPTRQEHVQHARSSAAFVARAIVASASSSASPSPTYSYLPYYYSRVFDLSWVFYGRASNPSDGGGETAVEFGEHSRENDVEAAAKGEKKVVFGTFHLNKEKKIVGVFLEGGSPEDNAAVKKLVESGGSEKEGLEWAEGKTAKL